MKKFIILGYGNPDRGDDGVAYYILNRLIQELCRSETALSEFQESGIYEINQDVDIWYNLQLIPEVSQDLANYQNAIFIDAHTAEIPEEILVTDISPHYQNSPFTHHLTPASCLDLADQLFERSPHATLITIRGYQFDFSRELSGQTQKLAEQALTTILEMIKRTE
jgi:hydrogenase maturation protease